MSRCCCGGIPSFSSTRSLIRSTFRGTSSQGLPVVGRGRTMEVERTRAMQTAWKQRTKFISISKQKYTQGDRHEEVLGIHYLVCGFNVNLNLLSGQRLKQARVSWVLGQILGTILILHFPSYPTRILEDTGILFHETAMRSVPRKVFL